MPRLLAREARGNEHVVSPPPGAERCSGMLLGKAALLSVAMACACLATGGAWRAQTPPILATLLQLRGGSQGAGCELFSLNGNLVRVIRQDDGAVQRVVDLQVRCWCVAWQAGLCASLCAFARLGKRQTRQGGAAEPAPCKHTEQRRRAVGKGHPQCLDPRLHPLQCPAHYARACLPSQTNCALSGRQRRPGRACWKRRCWGRAG